MNERTLRSLRALSDVLKNRKKTDITISFTKTDGGKEVIYGKYDGLFSTVELVNTTVPARELRQWLKLLYGADVKTVNVTY
jgi:hypothetical protein